jgi:hypothetical protein
MQGTLQLFYGACGSTTHEPDTNRNGINILAFILCKRMQIYVQLRFTLERRHTVNIDKSYPNASKMPIAQISTRILRKVHRE